MRITLQTGIDLNSQGAKTPRTLTAKYSKPTNGRARHSVRAGLHFDSTFSVGRSMPARDPSEFDVSPSTSAFSLQPSALPMTPSALISIPKLRSPISQLQFSLRENPVADSPQTPGPHVTRHLPLVTSFCGVHYPVMAGRKKMSPAEMREFVHTCRGKFKAKPSDKPFAERMAELNRKEKELEEKRCRRLSALGNK